MQPFVNLPVLETLQNVSGYAPFVSGMGIFNTEELTNKIRTTFSEAISCDSDDPQLAQERLSVWQNLIALVDEKTNYWNTLSGVWTEELKADAEDWAQLIEQMRKHPSINQNNELLSILDTILVSPQNENPLP